MTGGERLGVAVLVAVGPMGKEVPDLLGDRGGNVAVVAVCGVGVDREPVELADSRPVDEEGPVEAGGAESEGVQRLDDLCGLGSAPAGVGKGVDVDVVAHRHQGGRCRDMRSA